MFQQVSFIVTGDSMEPTYRQGDLVVVDREAKPKEGDVVAVKVLLEEGWSQPIIKRYFSDGDGHVTLRPDNPNHEEQTYSLSEVDIMGVVASPDASTLIIPFIKVKWFDERKGCRHVFKGQRPPDGCSSLVMDGQTKYGPRDYPTGTCMLFPPKPCAFDDPSFEWVYVEATRLATEEAGITDGIFMPSRKHLEEAIHKRQNEEASGQA